MSEQYYYAVARTAELENKLLSRAKLDQLTEAQDAPSALRALSGTVYAESAESLQKPEEFEGMLTAQIRAVLSYIREVCPDKALADLYLIAYDVFNLKVLLRCEKTGKDPVRLMSSLGIYEPPALTDAFESGDFSKYPKAVGEAVSTVHKALSAGSPVSVIDLTLDRAQYAAQAGYAKKCRNNFIKNYVRVSIDLANLRDFLRTRTRGKGAYYAIFIEGGTLPIEFFDDCFDNTDALSKKLDFTPYAPIAKSAGEGDPAAFERDCDDYLTEYVRAGKKIPFGPEPLMGYVSAKLTEVAQLRIILVGKINGMRPEVIRQRLRQLF